MNHDTITATTTRIGLLVILMLFSGCRTYGGWESEDLTKEGMASLVTQFERELNEARSFSTAARESVSTQSLDEVIALHALALEAMKTKVSEMEGTSSYRRLSRGYRSLIDDRARIGSMYQRLLLNGDRITLEGITDHYAVFPAVYPAAGNGADRASMLNPARIRN